jgi:CRP/FNR family cyclic AMP-dependent transcriptional regulator
MKSNIREFQSPALGASAAAAFSPATGQRFTGVRQALTALRDEDPAFDKSISTHHFERGATIATPEDLSQRMYVLMTGKVNMICTNNEGRRLVIASLDPGAVFGEGALDSGGDANVFAEAVDDVAVWVIPAGEARNMTMQYPILGWGLLQTYGLRLLQVENSLEDVAYKKLPERLATLLVELDDDGSGVIKGISHQALADRLGTYRETVSAILRDFKRQGVVELGYRRIRLVDVETLKEIGGIWDW